MPVPPLWEPEGGEPTARPPATPFRFRAARSVPVLDPDTYQEIALLGKGNTYKAVEVSGAWVLAEDLSGHRGWVPFVVIGRLGHPAAAFFVVLVTLAVVGLLGLLVTGAWAFTDGANAFVVAAEYVGVFLILVVGLGLAWRVGSESEQIGAVPGFLWQVSEPGADLTAIINGQVIGHLAAGTVVTEVQRKLGFVQVVTCDGATGWVAADRLQPAAEPEGGRQVGP